MGCTSLSLRSSPLALWTSRSKAARPSSPAPPAAWASPRPASSSTKASTSSSPTSTKINSRSPSPSSAGGDRVRSVVADLTSQAGADKVRDATDWDIDILVHTAGVTGAKGDPLRDITEEDWEHAWQTDFMSGVRMSKALVPPMLERGWGRVVFVTSENVAQPYPDEMVYNAAKAAVLTLVKGMGQRYAPQGRARQRRRARRSSPPT